MNTRVNFAGIEMKNPVTVASGTFGYGREYSDFFDLGELGAVITKGTSLKPKSETNHLECAKLQVEC